MSDRPLPPVVGGTENALRALLVEALDASPISGYEAWIYLNVAAGAEASEKITEHVSEVLKQPVVTVAATRSSLIDRGLLDASDRLTPAGRAELDRARALVSSITSEIVDGIEPAKLRATIETLEVVRERAERQLRTLQAG